MKRFKRTLQNLTLLISTIIIFLFVIEGLSAVFITGPLKDSGLIEPAGTGRQLRLKLFPPNLDRYRTPSANYSKWSNQPREQETYHHQTDSFQSITSTTRGQPEPNGNNIFFAGGSTTESMFVNEELRTSLTDLCITN